ncbi:hypothetical protein FRC10_008883 [Ceratobasidium sp. 414]|nr:hypothetical protein FRC10_008883 [Ceratobasidium sp. 414]
MADPSNLKEAQALVNKLAEISNNMRQAATLADAFSQSIVKLFPNDSITASAPAVAGKKRGRVPKEGKRVKDPNAPKRPATSYILFQNDIRDELKGQHPGLPYKELLGKVSEAWQKLAETEKKNYQNQADENMAKYNRAVLDYKGTSNGHAPVAPVEPTPEADEEEEEEEEEPAPPAKKQKAAPPQPAAESSDEESGEEESGSEETAPPPPPPAKKPKSGASVASAAKEKKKARNSFGLFPVCFLDKCSTNLEFVACASDLTLCTCVTLDVSLNVDVDKHRSRDRLPDKRLAAPETTFRLRGKSIGVGSYSRESAIRVHFKIRQLVWFGLVLSLWIVDASSSKYALRPNRLLSSTLALQRRCAASTSTKPPSTASTRPFPPPESVSSDPASGNFDAKVWASLQPPPASALSTLAARLRIPVSSDSDAKSAVTLPILAQVVTHPSFVPLHQHYYPHELPPAHNGMLAALGNSLMGLFATEWLAATYPHLPTLVVKAAVSAYVGPASASAVAREWGAVPLLRWQRTPSTPIRQGVMHDDAIASVARALTGLIYHAAGSMDDARTFVHAHFLSREFDLRSLLKFSDPKLALIHAVRKYRREPPISRLLAESGRASNSPTFVVGVFSGEDKLGEGFGSSLRMAEHRAAQDAMHRLYLTRQPSSDFKLPTAAFPPASDPSAAEALTREDETESPFKLLALSSLPSSAEAVGFQYSPGILGDSEMLYGSAGRTARVAREKLST